MRSRTLTPGVGPSDQSFRPELAAGCADEALAPAQQLARQRGITITTVLSKPDGAALAELLPLAVTGEAPIRIAAKRPLNEAADLYREAVAASGSDGRWLLIP